LKKEFSIKDTWLSFELHPETPQKGIPLAERFSETGLMRMFENLRNRSKELGITFSQLSKLSNSRMVLEASEFARDMGKYDRFHEQVFYAYFTELKDIGNIDTINEIALSCGLNIAEMRHALMEHHYAGRLDETREEARRINLSGVPTYLINDHYKIVGAQPAEVFKVLFKKIETT
jgi:predicted DsbA family dithiol-disulfide isomerase